MTKLPSPAKASSSSFSSSSSLVGGGRNFCASAPLHYTGNRGSGAHNVMGTVMPSALAGHWRYAHINAIRGDGINPGLLGMKGVVSEDAVRLGMARIDETAGLDWLSTQILESISPTLGLPWILDIDVTVKPLYGHQQGAAIGYNPQKPDRPSHVYHSYFVANLRISLGVEIRPGNEHAAAKGLPRLWQTLEKLPRHQWPTFTRGDSGYGNESVMVENREKHVGKRTAKPSCPRRKARAGTPAPPPGAEKSPSSSPRWASRPTPPKSCPNTTATVPMPKTASTSSKTNGAGAVTPRDASPPASLWPTSLRSFTTGGTLYLRFYDEDHHREAIRTRPMLMSGVGRQVQSGGQRTVKVSVLH